MKTFPKHQQAPPLTAIIAAQKCMAERGHVVIGFPSGNDEPLWAGRKVHEFAGHLIEGYVLVVTKRTTRADWDEQARLLFGENGLNIHPKATGQRFYACKLVTEAQR